MYTLCRVGAGDAVPLVLLIVCLLLVVFWFWGGVCPGVFSSVLVGELGWLCAWGFSVGGCGVWGFLFLCSRSVLWVGPGAGEGCRFQIVWDGLSIWGASLLSWVLFCLFPDWLCVVCIACLNCLSFILVFAI